MAKKSSIQQLGTEGRNRSAASLDTMSALAIARLINREDQKVPRAVTKALPQIAKGIDLIAKQLASGGRMIYVGAGTSGRIAALDASELPPTFNTDPATVQYVIAGGDKALSAAAEFNEDSEALGQRDIARKNPGRKDVVVGIAASGRTPYTVAGVRYAKRKGAKTIAIACNPGSPLEKAADVAIVVNVGPEVVSGSSRMKAGTAQKLVLNMLSTGAMARLGYVYGNLMVNVHLKNEKLVERGIGILQEATDADRKTAERTLKAAGNRVTVAMLMLQHKLSPAAAKKRLQAANGNVRKALGR
ncbi:MAG TPA: N-acetylmuramic acid 6-phosphate etherase, partial [Blastocatellia bacterium]|jgi:N-acetylmuramic acid 6-phosphate etherase|nr:N-acetylmuramic acid 6-phosphate etherase [Blastocatellia bacterium]